MDYILLIIAGLLTASLIISKILVDNGFYEPKKPQEPKLQPRQGYQRYGARNIQPHEYNNEDAAR